MRVPCKSRCLGLVGILLMPAPAIAQAPLFNAVHFHLTNFAFNPANLHAADHVQRVLFTEVN